MNDLLNYRIIKNGNAEIAARLSPISSNADIQASQAILIQHSAEK